MKARNMGTVAIATVLLAFATGCAGSKPPIDCESAQPDFQADGYADAARYVREHALKGEALCETDAECEMLDSLLTSLGWTWTPEDSI